MELLLVPVPIFTKELAVEAFLLRYQRYNKAMPFIQSSAILDGAMQSPLLEVLNLVGVEAFAMEGPIFVPVSCLLLLSDLSLQCNQPPERIIFLIEDPERLDFHHFTNMIAMRKQGFRFALSRCSGIREYVEPLELSDFVMLSSQQSSSASLAKQIKKQFPHITLISCHIDTNQRFDQSSRCPHYSLFEGQFYRIPYTKGNNTISPLKINLIKLLNTVQNESFEFQEVVEIIQRDTALSLALLRMINSPYLGLSQQVKDINQAVTLLGMREVRKWATTAVSRSLGTDKPDELTRISLMRAKYAENLAPLLNLGEQSQSVFLAGLFSILDVVLEMPMGQVLEIVQVVDSIYDALVNDSGILFPVLRFVTSYETADWQEVSRLMILYDLAIEDVYSAYVDASLWYRDLIGEPLPAKKKKKSSASRKHTTKN